VLTSAATLAFLRDVRLFETFDELDLAALAVHMRECPLRRNQILFREGDPGDEIFIVRRGTILISKAVTGKVEQVLVRVDPGDFFGEMSDGLQALTETNPRGAAAFFHAMVRVFIERLRRSTLQVAEATRWGLEATGLDVEAR